MIDLSQYVPFSNTDARVLAPGELSHIEFDIAAGVIFAPTYFVYQNTDNIVHNVKIQLAPTAAGPFGSIYNIDIPAQGTRILFPGQTIPSSGTPILETRGPYFFTGPLVLIFRNSTAAAIVHTPVFNARWVQAKSFLQLAEVPITPVIT